jgi:sugar O-acyltransferase (sialic acid O-acetyltransferase NeuD family)
MKQEGFLKMSPLFAIGIGGPQLRHKMAEKFTNFEGNLKSTINSRAVIGQDDVTIGNGCNLLANSLLSNSVVIGGGCIVYYNITVTHDCIVEDFVELSPDATLLGKSKIGTFTQIDSNATVLANKKIGNNVIGASAVVTKDVPDNVVVAGVPARIIKTKS